MKAWGVFLVFYRGAGYRSETRVSAPNRERAHAMVAEQKNCVEVMHSEGRAGWPVKPQAGPKPSHNPRRTS